MGNFKDKNGKSRVGKFLKTAYDKGKDIAPDVLDIAGDITGIDALNRLGKAIDKDDTMPEDTKEAALAMIELDKIEMAELTKRHQADMQSDSWLSKNVRPMILVFAWILLAVFMFLDGKYESFNIPREYFTLLLAQISTVTAYYFGGREGRKKASIN